MKTIYIYIEGKVQEVGFRYFTLQKATVYNIKGTVKNNLTRRSVEIYCQGKGKDLEQFINKLRKGPALSVILKFNLKIIEMGPYKDFKII